LTYCLVCDTIFIPQKLEMTATPQDPERLQASLPGVVYDPSLATLPFAVEVDASKYATFITSELGKADPGDMSVFLTMGKVPMHAGHWNPEGRELTLFMLRHKLAYQHGHSLDEITHSVTKWLVHESEHAVDPTSRNYRIALLGSLGAAGVGIMALSEHRHGRDTTMGRLIKGVGVAAAAYGLTYYGLEPRERNARIAQRDKHLLEAASGIVSLREK
jgi:hypothetical protein